MPLPLGPIYTIAMENTWHVDKSKGTWITIYELTRAVMCPRCNVPVSFDSSMVVRFRLLHNVISCPQPSCHVHIIETLYSSVKVTLTSKTTSMPPGRTTALCVSLCVAAMEAEVQLPRPMDRGRIC